MGQGMSETVVIIGAGHAGGTAAATLRAEGFDGRIVLLGDETWPPYERPPLSKAVLSGAMALERTFLRKPAFYEEKSIELRTGTAVEAIDRAQCQVRLFNGETVAYDKLIIATGSKLRRLQVPGADLLGVYYLRGIDDSLAIKEGLREGAHIVIVGGGYIGLEVAASAAKAGAKVTVLEAMDRIMARVTSETVSHFFEDEHRKHGVDLKLKTGVTALEGGGRVERVIAGDGTVLPADLVVVGIGILAQDQLAQEAGLTCDNGIVVDEFTQTSDAAIWAIGDVTNHPNRLLGGRFRLESVQNAISQGQTAAKAILGKATPYAEVPWFWSDQYDLKLQTAGLRRPTDQEIVRGDLANRKFSVGYLRDGALAAIDTIANLKDFMPAKRLIGEKRPIDPERFANPDIPLAETARTG
jgi:3-phenylpropionate/trans-cinnamate dioxygenase ferredoxin reductase subunit